MAVDLETLARHGISASSYKKIFAQDVSAYPKAIQRLRDEISSEIKDGRTMNLTEWQAYHAIDLAYDISFDQTTPTFVHHILSQNLSEEQTLAALKSYGLSAETLFVKKVGPPGQPDILTLNVPVFFQILIPVVKSYLAVREATLFNARNQSPLLPYKPLKMTEEDQVLSEIWTDIVGTISRWYGYSATLRQAIHQMLKYGTMLTFTREEWHVDEQCVSEKGTNAEGETEWKDHVHTEKEGLRYHIPHPTRMYYDLEFPLPSINTDTGCRFMGHWWVESYGSILDNTEYWNRKRIFCGTNWFAFPGAENFWQEVAPCRERFPDKFHGQWNGGSPPSREDKAAWYTQSGGRNQAVFLTQHFKKIIPKQYGLGKYEKNEDGKMVLTDTYPYPVWHRFIVAGDDTIIWAGPCAYCPSWFMGYDHDENAGRNPSMALELIPWQDHLGNILSQMILTAKQNLQDVVFYDTNIINVDEILKLRNLGERRYRERQYIGYDSMMRRASQTAQQQAFQQVPLRQTSIVELLQLIPLILNILERVMQIAASEAGAQGTHQQSKFELQQIGGGSGNRVQFIGAAVDEGIDAWKKQLYDGATAYLDPEFEAQVSSDIPDLDELLQKMGLEKAATGTDKVLVKGHKSKLRLEGFAASNQANLETDREKAQTIFQVVGTIAGQEQLFQKIGADNLLSIIEFAARLAGAPRDFRLRTRPDEEIQKDEQPPENVLNAIKAAQQATMQHIEQEVVAPVAKEMATDKQRLDQLGLVVKQLQGIYDMAKKITDRDALKAKEVESNLQAEQAKAQATISLKTAESQAEEHRRNVAAEDERRRKEELHQQQLKQEAEKAALDQAITMDTAKAKIKAESEKAEATAKAGKVASKP